MPGAEELPPSMAVAPPKRMRRGPWVLVGAIAVRVWPQRGPGASSSVSQLDSTGRYVGAGISHGLEPIAMEKERLGLGLGFGVWDFGNERRRRKKKTKRRISTRCGAHVAHRSCARVGALWDTWTAEMRGLKGRGEMGFLSSISVRRSFQVKQVHVEKDGGMKETERKKRRKVGKV